MFRFACGGDTALPNENHPVLLEYSQNGGVTWEELVRLNYDGNSHVRCFAIMLFVTNNCPNIYRFISDL